MIATSIPRSILFSPIRQAPVLLFAALVAPVAVVASTPPRPPTIPTSPAAGRGLTPVVWAAVASVSDATAAQIVE